jgi:hypothetical protein
MQIPRSKPRLFESRSVWMWSILPDWTFLELPFVVKVGDAVSFPERDSVTCCECKVEFASCVCDEWVGS